MYNSSGCSNQTTIYMTSGTSPLYIKFSTGTCQNVTQSIPVFKYDIGSSCPGDRTYVKVTKSGTSSSTVSIGSMKNGVEYLTSKTDC